MIYIFFNETATTEIYTLSRHDALPISRPGVTERYEVELDATPGPVEGDGFVLLHHRRLFVQELYDAFSAGGGGVERVEEAAEAPDRAVQLDEVDHEDQKPSQREPPLGEPVGPEAEHQQDRKSVV